MDQKMLLPPSAGDQTSNYDVKCLTHHHSLLTLTFQGLSRSKRKQKLYIHANIGTFFCQTSPNSWVLFKIRVLVTTRYEIIWVQSWNVLKKLSRKYLQTAKHVLGKRNCHTIVYMIYFALLQSYYQVKDSHVNCLKLCALKEVVLFLHIYL